MLHREKFPQEWSLSRNAHGRLVLNFASGVSHSGVVPVRAFPLSAPEQAISLVSTEGQELLVIAHLQELPDDIRTLLLDEMQVREFVPVIEKILSVSTFSTPSTWTVQTDRGVTQLILKVEEDIRRLAQRGRLLISSGNGLVFEVKDVSTLDRQSKRLIERFL